METFRIRVLPGATRCTLLLEGEVDLAVADDIVALGAASLSETATQTLIIDLHAVTFIDSTAIGALIRLRNLATESDKRVELTQVPARVQKVLNLTGLHHTFDETSD